MVVLGLVDLEVVALVVVVDVVEIAAGVVLALIVLEDVALHVAVVLVVVVVVVVVPHVAKDAKEDVLDLVKGAQDALDAEDLVLVHVHRKERVRLVPHAIVVLAVLVRVLHVHLVEDVLDQVDAEALAMGFVTLAVMGLVTMAVLDLALVAKDHVNQHVQQDVKAVLVVMDLALVVLEDVMVVLVVLRDVMVVVMNVADNVRMHALLPVQQLVLVHAKLKHLEL